MVNYIWLAWKLTCMLRTYKTCNSTIGFSKYGSNNKLLDDVTLLRVTIGVTWTQPYIYILASDSEHALTRMLRGFSIFWVKINCKDSICNDPKMMLGSQSGPGHKFSGPTLIICIYYNLRFLLFPITKNK